MTCTTCSPHYAFTPDSPTCKACIQGSQHSDHRYYEEKKIQDLRHRKFEYKDKITAMQWFTVAIFTGSLFWIFVCLYTMHMTGAQ